MSLGRGGWTLLGITALMAAMDGALIATLAAAGIAVGSYSALCRMMHKSSSQLSKVREQELRAMLINCKDKELRKHLEAAVKSDLAELSEARKLNESGGIEAAKWASVGVFAFPPMAAAILLAKHILNKKTV